MEFHFPSVTSTNDYARELLDKFPYVFVSALHQTAGRGRKGRAWEGDFGSNVYCSLGMQHRGMVVVEELAAYMARGALSALHVLRQFAPSVQFRMKYPNDIQALTTQGWAKIAGVLIEHGFHGEKPTHTIVGVGINVEQTTFPDTISQSVTSLKLLGLAISARDVLTVLQHHLVQYRVVDWPSIHDQWVHELNIVGKTITLADDPGTYLVKRILHDGRLVAQNIVSQMERTVTDGDTVRYQDRDQ